MMALPDHEIKRLKRELVGKKVRVTADIDDGRIVIGHGDTGTINSIDNFGRMDVRWLSGRRALLLQTDPYEVVGCCSELHPHPNTDDLDPEEVHWIRGVGGAKAHQWGYRE